MSSRLIRRLVTVLVIGIGGFAVMLIITFLVGQYLFPAGDVSFEISRGYRYVDAGGYERLIEYKGPDYPRRVVIDARVEDWVVKNGKIFVARRPRVAELQEDDALSSWLLPDCEYWIIDLASHEVTQSHPVNGLECR